MDPNLFKLTNVRHQERLQNAAAARHFRQAGLPKPALSKRVLQNLGGLLIASGQKLKAQPQSNVATPAFGEG